MTTEWINEKFAEIEESAHEDVWAREAEMITWEPREEDFINWNEHNDHATEDPGY